MSPLFLLFDLRVDPVSPASPVPWAPLIVLLAVVFVLSVALVGGLVALLIWRKRKQAKAALGSAAATPGDLS